MYFGSYCQFKQIIFNIFGAEWNKNALLFLTKQLHLLYNKQ